MAEFRKYPQIESILLHTGQHYDRDMSKMFFDELDIPKPDINLGVGSGSHAEQTAEIMKRFERVLLAYNPTYVLVVGDVNSTIACALVASKLNIKVIHVEAGLRSYDRSMPEEINRVLTDAISDYLFITEKSAEENLLREGISQDKIYFVGNVMIDTLLKHRKRAEQSTILHRLGLVNCQSHDLTNMQIRNISINATNSINDSIAIKPYAVLTLHRPSNVDDKDKLNEIIEALKEVSQHLPIILSAHPRTTNRIKKFCLENNLRIITNQEHVQIKDGKINCIKPLGYLDFLHLMSNAKLVLTDSGGIQEETTILAIPCVTIRNNTERPITVTQGTNRLVGTKRDSIIDGSLEALRDSCSKARIPPLWDGKAAMRIANILSNSIKNQG